MVCLWLERPFFEFLEDMGERPSADHSIDRKDGDGNYSCGSLRNVLRMDGQLIAVGLPELSKGETRKMLGF